MAEPTKVRPIFPNFQHDAQGQPILTANEKLLIDDVSAIAQEADALRAGVETYNKWAKSHNAKVDAVVTPLSESQDTTFQKSVIHSIQLRGQ